MFSYTYIVKLAIYIEKIIILQIIKLGVILQKCFVFPKHILNYNTVIWYFSQPS